MTSSRYGNIFIKNPTHTVLKTQYTWGKGKFIRIFIHKISEYFIHFSYISGNEFSSEHVAGFEYAPLKKLQKAEMHFAFLANSEMNFHFPLILLVFLTQHIHERCNLGTNTAAVGLSKEFIH